MKLKEALEILRDEKKPVPIILQQLLNESKGSRKSASIFLAKYCQTNDNDELLEISKEEVWDRIVNAIIEIKPEAEPYKEAWLKMLHDDDIIPGGRISASVGVKGRLTAYNCYVETIREDSLEGIFDCLKSTARTHSFGGGSGVDISLLRPKGNPVTNAAKSSTGPISFMQLFSEATNVIGQNNRRGAQMITMAVNHPDIFDFVNAKQFDKQQIDDSIIKFVRGESNLRELKESLKSLYSVNHANISVRLFDDFMKAVEKDKEYELIWEPREKDQGGEPITKTIKAKDLWNTIIHNAWSTGEPGILFWDKITSEHNGEYCDPVVSTNPCGEQPLSNSGACLLSHINLSTMVNDPFTENASFNFDKFKQTISNTVRFLDSIIEYNCQKDRQALQSQIDASLNLRRMGLGLTGLGDCFFKLRMAYGSRKSKMILKEIMSTFSYTAYRESVDLAKEFGAFPKFEYDNFIQSEYMKRFLREVRSFDKTFEKDLKEFGIRNLTLMTIAPVGTGSEILGGVSSGIEPIFDKGYTRTVLLSDGPQEFTEYVSVVRDYFKAKKTSTLPDYFSTAYSVSPDDRIDMQSLMQKYIDSSISSTINLPKDTDEETVSKIYFNAWKSGLKGITVYREGSREGILHGISSNKNERGLLKKLFKNSKDLIQPREFVEQGVRYIIPYDAGKKATIVVDGDLETGTPYELLIWVKNSEDEQLAKTISMMLNIQLRRDASLGISSEWLLKELNSITSISGCFHKDDFNEHGVFIRGLAHAARHALNLFMNKHYKLIDEKSVEVTKNLVPLNSDKQEYSICKECGSKAVIHENGCYVCRNCLYSKCS